MDSISAYNAGHLQTALSQFSRTQAVGFSDCDYATQQLVDGQGIVQIAAWLRQNIADHDRLIVVQVLNQNPDQSLGVLGVSFSKRSSNSIARAGRTNGMTLTASAKVKFDSSGLMTRVQQRSIRQTATRLPNQLSSHVGQTFSPDPPLK